MNTDISDIKTAFIILGTIAILFIIYCAVMLVSYKVLKGIIYFVGRLLK